MVTATISSFDPIVYDAVVTSILLIIGEKLRLPFPSVTRTVLAVGEVDGNVYAPSWMLPVEEEIAKDPFEAMLVTLMAPI